MGCRLAAELESRSAAPTEADKPLRYRWPARLLIPDGGAPTLRHSRWVRWAEKGNVRMGGLGWDLLMLVGWVRWVLRCVLVGMSVSLENW